MLPLVFFAIISENNHVVEEFQIWNSLSLVFFVGLLLSNLSTLSLVPWILFRLPYARAVENGGLNESPEGSPRALPSHQPRLLRVNSSQFHGSRHRAPLSAFKSLHISLMAFSRAIPRLKLPNQ